eukprot:GHVP01021766.1.p1 GENE.GHVP01021766.1~~GHVP01021766.1.p1  ORF type:complete len:175 (+),score=44.24 GHVP01021766.1:297-821(+)
MYGIKDLSGIIKLFRAKITKEEKMIGSTESYSQEEEVRIGNSIIRTKKIILQFEKVSKLYIVIEEESENGITEEGEYHSSEFIDYINENPELFSTGYRIISDDITETFSAIREAFQNNSTINQDNSKDDDKDSAKNEETTKKLESMSKDVEIKSEEIKDGENEKITYEGLAEEN